MSTAVEIVGLRYCYPDGSRALDGITFRIGEGETVGCIGPNGAGKSTLLLHMNGILPEDLPPAGTAAVKIFGTPVSGPTLRAVRRDVGLLFQDPDDQLFCPTVFEDVAFGPAQFGGDPAEVRRKTEDALTKVGLAGYGSRSPHRLSGGEKQRVCLAGILACEPRILVLDEPTSDLDPRGKRQLKQLLGSIPTTKIIATHDLELVVELCPRVIVLDGGKIVADGPTAVLLSDERLMEDHGLEKPHILKHRHPH
ncbi:MAG TPA: ABC transporter ATP-binding protein [Bacteroidota bacterium]|nr:ABC transporter ATP-binding protein [Bacteroidota bacterium]